MCETRSFARNLAVSALMRSLATLELLRTTPPRSISWLCAETPDAYADSRSPETRDKPASSRPMAFAMFGETVRSCGFIFCPSSFARTLHAS